MSKFQDWAHVLDNARDYILEEARRWEDAASLPRGTYEDPAARRAREHHLATAAAMRTDAEEIKTFYQELKERLEKIAATQSLNVARYEARELLKKMEKPSEST